MNDNVEQNPFEIWYLKYPVFQGWVSSNEYDILTLNVAFAKLRLRVLKAPTIYIAINYAEYCIPAVLLFYAIFGFVIQ